jgi:ribosome-binding ATPase YchF (GTP1/OBG family)|tara:strand:- start:205 stop:435 length:231 start_codon:yes stop_codon:yes gene_type:complete
MIEYVLWHLFGWEKKDITMNTKELFDSHINTLATEYEKFQSGNKSAGTRARKSLSEIAKLCKVLRQEIQNEKNSDK